MKNSFVTLPALLCVFGSLCPAQAQSQPIHVQTQLLSSTPTAISVNVWLQNTGADTLRDLTYVWYMDWTDHGSNLVPELDYASVSGVKTSVIQRSDYLAEARFGLGTNVLLPGQTIQLQTRMHLKDWSAFQVSNDWSYAGLKSSSRSDNPYASLFSGSNRIWGMPEQYLGPTLGTPQVKVRTTQSWISNNTLALDVHLANTGTVPVTGLVARWIGTTLGKTSPVIAELDYSTGDSVKLRTLPNSGTRTELAIDLGNTIIGVGLEKTVQLRLHSTDWTNVDWTQDWSYAGVSGTAYNDKIEVEVKGYPITGIVPQDVDTDHDGWSDVVESALGFNPNDSTSHPSGATISGGMIQDTAVSHVVTYNASTLPGYSTRSSIPMTVDPGAVFGVAPIISIAPATAPKPTFSNAVQLGKTIEFTGAIRPGHSLTVPVPLPDGIGVSEVRNVQVVHYVNGQWQQESVSAIKNGAVYVTLTSFSPVAIGLAQQAKLLSAGDGHGLWVRKGRPWSTGDNSWGQLGNRTTTTQTGFGAVYWPSSTPVVAVAAGGRHSLALDALGNVWAWGDNRMGQCARFVTGNPALDFITQPVLAVDASLDPTHAVIQIAAGDSTSYAVTVNGQILSWGANGWQQLGHGFDAYTLPFDSVPKPVVQLSSAGTTYQPLDSFSQVAAGGRHAIALRYNSELRGWGANDFYQRTNGTDPSKKPYAVLIPFSVLSFGADTIRVGGCAGPNGTGCWSNQVYIPWYAPPSQIGANGDMSYAKLFMLNSENKMAANAMWGANDSGQIIPGSTQPAKMPISVTGTGRGEVALGRSHIVQYMYNGYTYFGPPINAGVFVYPVYARGSNGAGQSDPTAPGGITSAWKEVQRPGWFSTMISSAVAAGKNFSMSYDYGADSVYAWGGSVWGGAAVHSLTKTDGSFLEIVSPKNGDTLPVGTGSISVPWRLWQKDGTYTSGTATSSPCIDTNHCSITITQNGQTATVTFIERTMTVRATPLSGTVDRRQGVVNPGFLVSVPYPADSVKILLWALRRPEKILASTSLGALSKGNYSKYPSTWYDSLGTSTTIPDGSYGVSMAYHFVGRPTGWDTLRTTLFGAEIFIQGTKFSSAISYGGPDSFSVFLPSRGLTQGYLRRSFNDVYGIRTMGAWDLRDSGIQTIEVWNISDSLGRVIFDTISSAYMDWKFKPVTNGIKFVGGACFELSGIASYRFNLFQSEISSLKLEASMACNLNWLLQDRSSSYLATGMFLPLSAGISERLISLQLPGPVGNGVEGTWGLNVKESPNGLGTSVVKTIRIQK